MRSRPFKRDLSDRLDERRTRHLYACKCPRRRIVRANDFGTGRPGQVLQGTASCHQHRCGRAMRLWWRIKAASRNCTPSQDTP